MMKSLVPDAPMKSGGVSKQKWCARVSELGVPFVAGQLDLACLNPVLDRLIPARRFHSDLQNSFWRSGDELAGYPRLVISH